MLATNTILQNRYLILRQIGQGGMGAVYEAHDQRLGTTVALKETLVSGENLRKAFEREAQLLARLRHPVLPAVSDHFTEGDGQFLVMQFIPGNDLSDLLARNGNAFEPVQVLRWGELLLDALDYLHSQHPPIIHRDIKPNNLKLTARGEIILLDFGLAKGLAQTQAAATNKSVMGYTPHYAPLEQIEGTGTDPRSDLYALAATMYHLMTNVKPPDAMTRALSVLNGQPDPLQPANYLNPKVPAAVAAVLSKAMAQNRDERPASAVALRQALETAKEETRPMPPVTNENKSTTAATTLPLASSANLSNTAGTADSPTSTTPRITPVTDTKATTPDHFSTLPSTESAHAVTLPKTEPAASSSTQMVRTNSPIRKWFFLATLTAFALVLVVIISRWLINDPSTSAHLLALDANAASKDRNKPTFLAAKEILGRGITEARYFSVTAGPGEIKFSLNVVATGGTVYLELFDSKENPLPFQGNFNSLSVGASGHNEQTNARVYIDHKERVLMRVSNTYPNDTQGYRIRLDGAIELSDTVPATNNTSLQTLAALFADRDKPIPLPSKELYGRGSKNDRYYSFIGEAGEIKLTLDVIASGGTIYIELFDNDAKLVHFEGNYSSFSLASSGHHEQAIARFRLDSQQPLLMRISNTYPNDTKGYRLRFDGPVKLPNDKSIAADESAKSLVSLFANRDRPTPLLSRE
ncbi:MAG: protein kinase, partial [Acidobacteriota bacterium]